MYYTPIKWPGTNGYGYVSECVQCRSVPEFFLPYKKWNFASYNEQYKNSIPYGSEPPRPGKRWLPTATHTNNVFIDYFVKNNNDFITNYDTGCFDLEDDEPYGINVLQIINAECCNHGYEENSLSLKFLIYNKIAVCIKEPYKNGPMSLPNGTQVQNVRVTRVGDKIKYTRGPIFKYGGQIHKGDIVGWVTCGESGGSYPFYEADRGLSATELCAKYGKTKLDRSQTPNSNPVGGNSSPFPNPEGQPIKPAPPFSPVPEPKGNQTIWAWNMPCKLVVSNTRELFVACKEDRRDVVGRTSYIPFPPSNPVGMLKAQNNILPDGAVKLLSLKPQIQINSTTNILTWRLPKIDSVL